MPELSFTVLTEKLKDELIYENPDVTDELSMMLESFLDLLAEGVEVGVAIRCGCLLVRVFSDGEYTFISPIPLYEGASLGEALALVRDYAVREMLPLVFTDVPREDLEYYQAFFKMPEARTYADDDDTFFVRVLSECNGVKEIPRLYCKRLVLGEIKDADLQAYAGLCRDTVVNRYWGYDASVDNTEGKDEFYIEVARREYELAQALTLGVFLGAELIGEAVIYAFDFTGGASFGIRLLAKYQGRGFGSEVLSALISYSRGLGLDYLSADVMKQNTKSLKMMSQYFKTGSEKDGKIHFTLKLR